MIVLHEVPLPASGMGMGFPDLETCTAPRMFQSPPLILSQRYFCLCCSHIRVSKTWLAIRVTWESFLQI